jgi:ATP phosphoribosyltransferase
VPGSEFGKIYELFEIDPSTDIADAIQEISDSGRGLQLWEAFEDTIQVVDKHVWMS